MTSKPARHNPRRDVLLIQGWLGGRLKVSYSNVILRGPRDRVTIVFDTFACLYTVAPQYRVLSTAKQYPQDVRRALLDCRLPSRDNQMFLESLAQSRQQVTVDAAWTLAKNTSRIIRIPVGMVAFGHTLSHREYRALYTQPTASPARVLQRLQRYAAGQS